MISLFATSSSSIGNRIALPIQQFYTELNFIFLILCSKFILCLPVFLRDLRLLLSLLSESNLPSIPSKVSVDKYL